MNRIPLGKSSRDPRRMSNFLDTCAFDPKYTPEHESAQRIRKLRNENQIELVLAHSVLKEIHHPNTPLDVKREAVGMPFTIETELSRAGALILKPSEWLDVFEEAVSNAGAKLRYCI